MDEKIRKFIDKTLYPMIITPIEPYIKPNMTRVERVIAKQKVFFEIKELVNGAEIVTNQSTEEIIAIIKKMIDERNGVHEGCKIQYDLVKEMLEEIEKQGREGKMK